MHLIEIGHCVVFFCQVTNFSDGRNVTIHGIDAFKGNKFRSIQGLRSQFGLKIRQIIVLPNLPLGF